MWNNDYPTWIRPIIAHFDKSEVSRDAICIDKSAGDWVATIVCIIFPLYCYNQHASRCLWWCGDCTQVGTTPTPTGWPKTYIYIYITKSNISHCLNINFRTHIYMWQQFAQKHTSTYLLYISCFLYFDSTHFGCVPTLVIHLSICFRSANPPL